VSQEKSFRHAHIHVTEYEMTRHMAEAVSEGFKLASSVVFDPCPFFLLPLKPIHYCENMPEGAAYRGNSYVDKHD